jgi:hypothetical protein
VFSFFAEGLRFIPAHQAKSEKVLEVCVEWLAGNGKINGVSRLKFVPEIELITDESLSLVQISDNVSNFSLKRNSHFLSFPS